MSTRFIRWEVRTAFLAVACLFALILCGGTTWTVQPQPGPAVPGQLPEGDNVQAIAPRLPAPRADAPGPWNGKRATADPGALEARFEQAKHDAAQIIELGQSLKAELDKGNPNVVSVSVGEKAKQIEKLAKKIRKWSHAR